MSRRNGIVPLSALKVFLEGNGVDFEKDEYIRDAGWQVTEDGSMLTIGIETR